MPTRVSVSPFTPFQEMKLEIPSFNRLKSFFFSFYCGERNSFRKIDFQPPFWQRIRLIFLREKGEAEKKKNQNSGKDFKIKMGEENKIENRMYKKKESNFTARMLRWNRHVFFIFQFEELRKGKFFCLLEGVAKSLS